jgi:endoplasmic reticulum-Golgi intermediate compartment protein 3
MSNGSYTYGAPHQQYGYGGSYNNNGHPGDGGSSSTYNATSTTGGAASATAQATLRRRNADPASSSYNNGSSPYNPRSPKSSPNKSQVIKKLDFMFPKVDSEYTIRTDTGGAASLVAICIIGVLVLSEFLAWKSGNAVTSEHIRVDTSLGQKMRVNLNVTFPSLACEDLHVDVMDVAGDSQLNVEEIMEKRRLNMRGLPIGKAEIAESNLNQELDIKKTEILSANVPEGYCGPCFGAGTENVTCCNACDELIDAYAKKRWRTDIIVTTSEQCIREGRDHAEPKRMKKGEGCNLSGSMTLSRVAGNFHIAMGEGVERDGRHIHAFVPDDTPNFNASHIIHHLSFGAPEEDWADSYLNGAAKIVTKELGTTGLFQYFIKVVPTTYVEKKGSEVKRKETNRYFVTERFRPLMRELVDDDGGADDETATKRDLEEGKKPGDKEWADATIKGGHSNPKHHDVKNAILPGVFFIYEIYPFAVEVTPNSVPLTHLLIRIMATIGGVFTIVRWADSLLYRALAKGKRGSMILE